MTDRVGKGPTVTYPYPKGHFGGLCSCPHASNHAHPHEPGCVGYRGAAPTAEPPTVAAFMTPGEALALAESYMLRGERPRVDLGEVVRVLRGAIAGGWVWCSDGPPNNARSVLFATDEGFIYWGCFDDSRWRGHGFEQHERVVQWFDPPRTMPLHVPPKAVPPATTGES